MKRGKNNFTIKINFSNRVLYTLIAITILIVAGIGVYAYGTGSPTTSGHTGNEIAVDSTLCSAITGHSCGYDVDTDTDTNTWGPASTGLYGWAMTYNGWCNYKGSTTWRTYSPMYCTSTYSGTPECPSGYLKVMVGSSGSSYYYSCYKS